MRPDVLVLLSGMLTYGVPLLIAVRELIVLDRDRARPGPEAGDGGRDRGPAPAPDDDASLPPLPPCLIPEASSAPSTGRAGRPRVLEEA